MIKGLELAKKYYEEYGAAMIHDKFGGLESRIAVGLVGEGSECFGYDDEYSRDHDFGPSFCMWLTEEDFAKYGKALEDEYAKLPSEFMGLPTRNTRELAIGRVGVLQTEAFYAYIAGTASVPEDNLDWLKMNEFRLAAATNGRVFRDDLGRFTELRQGFLAYYPEDVRKKKIAACLAHMAQSGQYNYPRCMNRGEKEAAFLMFGDFVRQSLHVIYLLNKTYEPFDKWAFRKLDELPLLKNAQAKLRQVISLPGGKAAMIESICNDVMAELKRQGLSSSPDDFLIAQAIEVMRRIEDVRLRRMDMMQG